jgi:hypothetical protein
MPDWCAKVCPSVNIRKNAGSLTPSKPHVIHMFWARFSVYPCATINDKILTNEHPESAAIPFVSRVEDNDS